MRAYNNTAIMVTGTWVAGLLGTERADRKQRPQADRGARWSNGHKRNGNFRNGPSDGSGSHGNRSTSMLPPLAVRKICCDVVVLLETSRHSSRWQLVNIRAARHSRGADPDSMQSSQAAETRPLD